MELTPQQARFAELYQLTGNAVDSYHEAYGGTRLNASRNAWRTLRVPHVREYLEKIRGEARADLDVSREEMLDYFLSILYTPAGALDEDSPLVQEVREDERGRTVKMPSKMEAAKEIVRICGLAKAEKVEVSADDELSAILRAVTGARKE